MEKYYIYFLFLSLIITESSCERLHEQIYSSIEGGAACFRRLNGTHQAGCSSSLSGAVGVVHIIQNKTDAEWIIYKASAGPYMAVVNTVVFYDIIDLLIEKSDNVAGILLYDDPAVRPDAFSQESKCPNEYSAGPGSQCSAADEIIWNEKGTNLLRRNIPFPIFFLPQPRIAEIDKINECFQKYNLDLDDQNGKPLCSLQLNSFMYAAVDSVVCLRRSATSVLMTATKVCDPLGDYNVYYSLFPRAKETKTKKKPIILVTARIDSASLFDGVAPGAASSVVGMITQMVAATTLSQMIPITDSDLYDSNVLWTFFNGEAFDYIGSQRVAYDIAREAWPYLNPLSPKDINLHIELGQIGGSFKLFKDNASWPLYAYAPYEEFSKIPSKVNEFLQEMLENSNKNNLTFAPEFSVNLPPSSLHSFRRILSNETESGTLPEVLLTDFKRTFTNKFYQSALDDYESIGFVYHNISIGTEGKFVSTAELLAQGIMKDTEAQVKIARLATALSQTLYQQVAGKPYVGNISASAHLVDEMLYCFLRSQACRLLAAADYASGADDAPAERPAPLYVGVATWTGTPSVYVGHLITLLMGSPLLTLDRAACDKYEEEIARERASKIGAKRMLPIYVGSAARAGAPTWRAALLLALLTGARSTLDRTACNNCMDPGFSYYWLKGWNHSGICIQTTMNFSQAVSPAFVKTDYDMRSGEFSTWTESVWQAMWARVFVRASGAGAALAAAAGGAATLSTALLTYWLRRHAALIFADAPASVHSDATGIIRTVNC